MSMSTLHRHRDNLEVLLVVVQLVVFAAAALVIVRNIARGRI